MTRIFSPLRTDHIDNDRWVMIAEPFYVESDVLKEAGLPAIATVPAGFVQDFESIPLIRGRNKRGGTLHDYFSRSDSVPVVTKSQAAAIYFEFNQYTDSIDHCRSGPVKVSDWLRRWAKWGVVYVWPGYFHRFKVMATCAELAGIEGDPYITRRKLDTAIAESKETTAAIQNVPDHVEQKADMVSASEKATADLKDAKRGINHTGE